MYGYYNQNPYQFLQQNQTRQEVIKVNGANGANAFQMSPNSSTLLLDESEPIVYLLQTDGAGYKSVTPYKIEPYRAAPVLDMSDLEKRIERLENMIYAKPDNSSTKQDE